MSVNLLICVPFTTPFLLIILFNCKTSLGCGALVKSMCNDNITTKWNKKDIGVNLKMWIKGIEKLGSVKESDKENYCIRKKVLKDRYSKILKYIGNLNCLNKTTFGPIWKTPPEAISKKSQFQNGFLYGVEDGHGTLTGIIIANHMYARCYNNVLSLYLLRKIYIILDQNIFNNQHYVYLLIKVITLCLYIRTWKPF